MRAGLPVPDEFHVPTAAYRQFKDSLVGFSMCLLGTKPDTVS